MRISQTGDLWWKTAVFYCADVETFQDSDGDGVGDLRGMTEPHRVPRRPRRHLPVADAALPDRRPRRRLRHHRLLRRRPAPGHLRRLRRAGAHRPRRRHPGGRRLRHEPHLRPAPVVQAAPGAASTTRTATTTSGRATKPRSSKAEVVFPDKEDSIWELDEKTGEYYLHHFYRTQPDLNVANPARAGARSPSTLGFWLAARRLRLPHRRRALPLRHRHLPGVRAERLQPARPTSRTCATSSPAASATPSCSARSTCPTRSRRSSSAARTATG